MSATHCDVCHRTRTWGCGHSGSQERDARRHEATKKHQSGACWHYNHDDCDPATCKLAGIRVPGYVAFVKHQEVAA